MVKTAKQEFRLSPLILITTLALWLYCDIGNTQPIDSLHTPYVEWNSHTVSGYTWRVPNYAWIEGPAFMGGLWVGGTIDGRRFVALSNDGNRFPRGEFNPPTREAQIEHDELPIIRTASGEADELALLRKSDQDIIVVFYDTASSSDPLDPGTGAPHVPSYLRVQRSSYTWSYHYTKQFLLVDYEIANIGKSTIADLYLGFLLDARDSRTSFFGTPQRYVYGYIPDGPVHTNRQIGCDFRTRKQIMWFASPDGLPNPGTNDYDSLYSRRSIVGVQILHPDPSIYQVGFDWWISDSVYSRDFGPRLRSTSERQFMPYQRGLGTPTGDLEQYDMISNQQIDYDQLFTALDHSGEGFLYPPEDAVEIATGRDNTMGLISIGPLGLARGAVTHFTIAIGLDPLFHNDPLHFEQTYNPYDPRPYMEGLDYTNFLETMGMAKWVYDNPGYDTDQDGYLGDYFLCQRDSVVTRIDTSIDSIAVPPETSIVIDTIGIRTLSDTVWANGDGVPDFRAAAAPEPPKLRFSNRLGSISIEWNGLTTETTRDVFTNELDFEGYRVYIGVSNRDQDFVLAASYDLEDYTQWYFNPGRGDAFDTARWEVLRKPFSLQEVRDNYGGGNVNWHPLDYTIDNPVLINDSLFYFAPQDWNDNELTDTTKIHRIYPNEPHPHTLNRDSAFTHDTLWVDPITQDTTFYSNGELTPDGQRFKYFEYRCILDNLLPSQPYFVTVTAIDYGSPESGVPYLETNKVQNAIQALAQDQVAQVEPLDVIVYPNPYRIDGNYREKGFEGRGSDLPSERTRLVHFTNLPPQCDIKIYTLDGDMVRQIIHDKSPGAADAMHDTWDVLSRNLQVPVSGIYYWVVETPDGRVQLGKLVLIM